MTAKVEAGKASNQGSAAPDIKRMLKEAHDHYRAGRIDKADAGCRAVIARAPNNVDALHLLGLVVRWRGDHESAATLFRRASELSPDFADAHYYLGNCYMSLGRHEEALAAFNRASALSQGTSARVEPSRETSSRDRPAKAEAAATRVRTEPSSPSPSRRTEAPQSAAPTPPKPARASPAEVEAARKPQSRPEPTRGSDPDATRHKPHRAEVAAAEVKAETARTKESQPAPPQARRAPAPRIEAVQAPPQEVPAVTVAEPAAAPSEQPSAPDPEKILVEAFEHHRAGRIDEAEAGYRAIIAINAGHVDAVHLLGLVMRARGDHEAAAALFRLAIELSPNFGDAHYNLGNACLSLGKPQEAIAAYGRALEIRPDNALALFNLGNTYRDIGQPEKAVDHFSHAVKISPEYTEAWHNMANVLKDLGELDLALHSYRRVIKISPELAEGHYNFALALLLNGDLKRGFAEYEWRWEVANFPSPKRNFSQPQWKGEKVPGRTVLVHCEQGYGDAIQFSRYLPLLAERCGRVVVECAKPIAGLLGRIKGVAAVVPAGRELPPFDLHCPMLSLPHALGTTRDTIPSAQPFLKAVPIAAERLRAITDAHPARLRIGLVWAGNPQHGNDLKRSIDLREFLVLPKHPGVEFFSLQKGAAAKALPSLGLGPFVHDLDPHIEDFEDLAAAIDGLDLVISVDSAPAHLAGAMGKPVWTLLPFAPDWRWLLSREDTDWYPTMRLFRQVERGNWSEVMARVAAAITERWRALDQEAEEAS